MSDIRTPPSLKWLITKRARLVGEIKKVLNARERDIDKLMLEMSHLSSRIAEINAQRGKTEASANQFLAILQADLNAIDATIRLHEIGIDPSLIPPVKTQEAGRLIPYGEITRLTFEALRLANGQSRTTTEIALYVLQQSGLELELADFQDFRYSVRQRLKYHCRDGTVKRAHQAKTCLEGRWLLGDSFAEYQ